MVLTSVHEATHALWKTLEAWNLPFPAPVICWRTSRCAGGLGIWDALSELVLAGSAESFLRGWVAGSWLAGLKTEGESFLRREGTHCSPPPATVWQD